MIESFVLCRIHSQVLPDMLTQLQQCCSGQGAASFDHLPTRMIFPPNTSFAGSLHGMFFPPGTKQRFHYHPSVRYLLIVGDVAVKVHYSTDLPPTNPHSRHQMLLIEPGVLTLVRFPGDFWHYFESSDTPGLGVFAIAFHENDAIEQGDSVNPFLMEEKTFFWSPE